MRPGAGQASGGSGLERGVIALCAAVLGAAAVVFLGAWVSTRVTGGSVDTDPSGWLNAVVALGSDPSAPSAAWGSSATGVPGPAVYWLCTGLVAAGVVAAGWGLWRLWQRMSPANRERFGVDTDARQARPGDVRTLAVGSAVPPAGRFLLGAMAPRGPVLATEDRDRYPLSGRRGRRQGSRGSVALIGPTQAGKTALLSSGMIGWDGPVVALSVKRDLYDVTASARSTRGEVAVFDPGGSTGLPTAALDASAGGGDSVGCAACGTGAGGGDPDERGTGW